jgi:capsular exopolysaccharide synthesis family protein
MAVAQLPAARIVSRAVPPSRPSVPAAPMIAIFGAFVGLFLAAGACILGPMLRRRVGSVGELAALTGLPNIGSLPVRRGMPARILKADQSDAAETLRGMRLALQPRRGEGNVVLVTSLGRGDGKTTVAASLARLCAADGMRVLLVEGDLRRPGLAAALDATPAATLESVLGEAGGRFDGAVHVDAASGLHCLFAAGDARNPQALLASPRLGELLDAARQRYELVVVDSPPVLRVADPVLLARECDRILLVVGFNRTRSNTLVHAVERFPEDALARMATVLNRVPARDLAAQGYYAGYGRSAGRRLPAPTA